MHTVRVRSKIPIGFPSDRPTTERPQECILTSTSAKQPCRLAVREYYGSTSRPPTQLVEPGRILGVYIKAAAKRYIHIGTNAPSTVPRCAPCRINAQSTVRTRSSAPPSLRPRSGY